MVNPERPRPYADIACRLRWVRSIYGLDQREFAARADLNYSRYKNWESGAGRIGLDGALALRATYDLPLDFIYIGEPEALPMNLRKAWLESPSDKS